MDMAAHMAAVREREASADTQRDARSRSDAIFQRLRGMHVNELGLALQREKRPGKKVMWLNKIGDALSKAAEGIAPCKAGCSHCCNMATLVSVDEAKAIAKATGRTMTMPALSILTREGIEIEQEQYFNVPCPMLKDGACSIYDHRPWACRVHYSVDADDLLCKMVPGETIIAPYMQTAQFNILHIMSHECDPLSIQWGDIRDFFP